MSNGANHNRSNREKDSVGRLCQTPGSRMASAAADAIQFSRKSIHQVRHIYVHIPFCARICPYCAFYKDLLDRSQTSRFCEALLRELELHESCRRTGDRRSLLRLSTIYFGGGTPTALNIAQLELLLRGFHETLDLSRLVEWTMEANPGSVSARKAALLKKFGVNRISLGVQSWDDELLKLLGREHNARQAEESFRILRDAGFTNLNVDLMFGLPGQTCDQWRATLERTIGLQPEHISTYCLTYEEDTEFFLRHARGEFRQDAEADAEFFEMTMAILEGAGFRQYEISNYAHPGCESVHNRAYWLGKDYLGIGPSAVSTIGMQRWQNVCDYRSYIDRLFSGQSPRESTENLTHEMKRTEQIALGLRTRDGVSASELKDFAQQIDDLIALELLRKSNGNFVLTRRGKALADSVTEAFF
jgi:putative oxygen-independent coproporphyrinogen III oxidase